MTTFTAYHVVLKAKKITRSCGCFAHLEQAGQAINLPTVILLVVLSTGQLALAVTVGVPPAWVTWSGLGVSVLLATAITAVKWRNRAVRPPLVQP